jgi:hypothetical protein
MVLSLTHSHGFAHERAVRGDKGGTQVGGEAGEQRFEDVVRQRIGVFARRKPLRQPIVAAPSTPAQST